MTVLTILGARPQFIKAAALSKALAKEGITEVLVHTGQHYDANMSADFFAELGLAEPKHHLAINGGSDNEQTARMMLALEPILEAENPDLVIVFGDTNTTLAGALSSKKLKLPLAHIEAGMRSYLPNQPEEVNRVLSDRISDLCFTSSALSQQILLKEGIPSSQVFNCGDLMYDLFLKHWEEKSLPADATLTKNFALLTFHRQENVDDPKRLRAWVGALNELAKEIDLVCPLHPRTRKKLAESKLHLEAHIIAPQPYLNILGLIDAAQIVITDSGGLQKETYFGRKACLTLRAATEWTELIESGTNRLCTPDNLLENYRALSTKDLQFSNLYGDGKSAQAIAHEIRFYIENSLK